jgi:hypothetical protein
MQESYRIQASGYAKVALACQTQPDEEIHKMRVSAYYYSWG